MKYLCLVYEAESTLDAMPIELWPAFRQERLEYMGSLRESGHLLDVQRLQGTRTGVLVRVRNNELFTCDGPFAKTKEQISEFLLIDAEDFNEALRIASRLPSARLGTIEVRPIDADKMNALPYEYLNRKIGRNN
jgi:hypothetical protein